MIVETCYCMVENYRCARRKESVVLFNAYNGACVELDKKSEDILKFIQKEQPIKQEIVNYANKMDVLTQDLEALILCLKETGFIYEN